MSKCDWFKCGGVFKARDTQQRFCSKICQDREKNWRQMRGATIARLLIPWRQSRNWSKAQCAAWEARNNKSVPSLADVSRMVDSWVAEIREGGV